MIFIRLVKIDFYMNHLVSHLLPLFCYQEEKEKKKKEKKIRTALPGHFGLSVRSLLTLWKKNGAEACGLLYRNRLSLAFRTVV